MTVRTYLSVLPLPFKFVERTTPPFLSSLLFVVVNSEREENEENLVLLEMQRVVASPTVSAC